MKLDTAKDILEWVQAAYENSHDDYYVLSAHQDTETAEYLAYCVRVTAIVEREESRGMMANTHDIITEAKEQGK